MDEEQLQDLLQTLSWGRSREVESLERIAVALELIALWQTRGNTVGFRLDEISKRLLRR